MARPLVVASGSASAQAETGSGILAGLSARESAGTPALAVFQLCDGTSSAGPLLATVSLGASGSQNVSLPAVPFNTGIYVNRVTGSTEIVLYLE